MPYKALLWIITRAPGVFRARKYLRSPKHITPTAQSIEHADLGDIHDAMRAQGMRPCLAGVDERPSEIVGVWVRDETRHPPSFSGHSVDAAVALNVAGARQEAG